MACSFYALTDKGRNKQDGQKHKGRYIDRLEPETSAFVIVQHYLGSFFKKNVKAVA